MISFFTSLKPFRGTTAIQQTNALRSWRRSIPGSEIIVFGATQGDDGVLVEVEATRRPDMACNDFGTPLISAMFAEAQRSARHSQLCYINGDIVLLPDFAAAAERLERWKAFMAVGQRWDLDWDLPIDFTRRDWSESLRETVVKAGVQHDGAAMDFFLFRRGAVGELPAFAIGRPGWDNYLIKHALQRRTPIVDVSSVVTPIHQNHDYAHVPQRRGSIWEGPEADRNRQLAIAAVPGFEPALYTVSVSQWIMLRSLVVPALSRSRLANRLWAATDYRVRRRLRVGLARLQAAWFLSKRLIDLHGSTLAFRLLPRRGGEIAVVRVDNIGDFILWLDGARAIRARYPRPDYRITLVASSKWSDFAKASGLFDDVIAVDTGRFAKERAYRWVICRRIASRRFAIAINPTFSRNVFFDDFLMKATGAPVRIGQVGDLSNATRGMQKFADNWYTELVHGSAAATHELEKNAHFAKRFDPQAPLRRPRLEPAMVCRPPWLLADKDYFVLFPGTFATIKAWPAERFGELAARIQAKTGWSAIVCGAASDAEAADQVIEHAEGVRIINACVQTSLPELAGVIGGAKLTVTNDTSAAHFAAALGVPAVAIVGGGHFGRFLPYPAAAHAENLRVAHHAMPCYQCYWGCVYPIKRTEAAPCITSVSIEDVWARVQQSLDSDLHVARSGSG
ncbi:MAG: glycosyltransferase family 9 protein [Xanthobacteraceae bacterium]